MQEGAEGNLLTSLCVCINVHKCVLFLFMQALQISMFLGEIVIADFLTSYTFSFRIVLFVGWENCQYNLDMFGLLTSSKR